MDGIANDLTILTSLTKQIKDRTQSETSLLNMSFISIAQPTQLQGDNSRT
jgi:hypothetical protein